MGANTSIGLVYDPNKQNLKSQCSNLINALKTKYDIKVDRIQYSTEKETANWITVDNPDNAALNKFYSEIESIFMVQISLSFKSFKDNAFSTVLRIIREKNVEGFLLDISEEDIIPDYSESLILEAEDFICSMVRHIYKYVNFEYGFCDQEAEIEYSPKDFFNLGYSVYSLEFIPTDLSLKIKKSDWDITGLNERK
ncbi:Imm64 family immunity protein [Brevibacillus daliensis]|uniref:Imm64 family immunity protein n=1 Tax=Brevibacillus daliensis TaxID=2892995 RepID=UPI001E2A6C8A|nr:Imm64 family immunity protein [Brevibacillus daliensis]